jgi:hypothetical protein
VLAGIGFALKPYFLAIPALVELLLLVRLGWRALFARAESLALALTVTLYVLGAILLLRDYLKFTIGFTLDAYWAFSIDNFPLILERFEHVAQPFAYGALIALVTRTWSSQHSVMLLALLGYSVSYFIQSKGFVYHAYPVLVCSAVFLGICVGAGVSRAWASYADKKTPLNLIVLVAVALFAVPPIKRAHDDIVRWYFTYNFVTGPIGQYRRAVIDLVNREAPTPQSYFFAFTTHPFPGFPTASYTTAEYAGRSIAQNFIPAYARLDEVTDPIKRAGIVRAAEYQRRTVIEDFERRPPSIVFVDAARFRLGMNGRTFDDLGFYLRDPRFQRIWANFEEYPRMGPLRVFVRRTPAMADP